jgi:hypothetical protein
MVVNPGHALNHQRYARQRPEIRVKAVPPRTSPQRLLHLSKLPGFELWFAACTASAVQCANAAAPPLRVPSAHTLTAHFQLTSDRGQNHVAGGKQAASLFAATFELLEIAAGTHGRRHTSSIGDLESSVTIFREIVTVLCEIQ